MVRSSRVDQPPVSGVPVAGATVYFPRRVRGWIEKKKDPQEGGGKKGKRGRRGNVTGRIQSIDIDAQIDGFLGPDSAFDLLDDARGADVVDGAGLDDLEAAVAVVVVVGQARQSGADPGVDVGVVGEEAFAVRVVEVGAVVDGRLGGWGAAEDARAPGVAVFDFGREDEVVTFFFFLFFFFWEGRRESGRGLQVRVKMNDGDGAVGGDDAA